MKLKPRCDRVLLKVEENDKTEGGIYIPKVAQRQSDMFLAEVIDVGDEVPDDILPGQRVMIASHLCVKVRFGKEEFVFCSAKDVGAVVVQ